MAIPTTVTLTSTATGSPAKLRDGSWGARLAGAAYVGQPITVRTAAGKTWLASVASVVWTDGAASIVTTTSAASTAHSAHAAARSGARPRARYTRPCGYPGCTGGRSCCDECTE